MTTIDKISYSELMHYRIQAILRTHNFPDFSYVGVINGEHIYNISGNLIPVSQIQDVNEV